MYTQIEMCPKLDCHNTKKNSSGKVGNDEFTNGWHAVADYIDVPLKCGHGGKCCESNGQHDGKIRQF